MQMPPRLSPSQPSPALPSAPGCSGGTGCSGGSAGQCRPHVASGAWCWWQEPAEPRSTCHASSPGLLRLMAGLASSSPSCLLDGLLLAVHGTSRAVRSIGALQGEKRPPHGQKVESMHRLRAIGSVPAPACATEARCVFQPFSLGRKGPPWGSCTPLVLARLGSLRSSGSSGFVLPFVCGASFSHFPFRLLLTHLLYSRHFPRDCGCSSL